MRSLILRNSGLKPLNRRRVESLLNFVILFDYDGEDPLMTINRNFRAFKHVNKERVNYSLAISVNDGNEEFFRELGCKIVTLACENKGKTAELKSLKLSDLEFIKTTANENV